MLYLDIKSNNLLTKLTKSGNRKYVIFFRFLDFSCMRTHENCVITTFTVKLRCIYIFSKQKKEEWYF